MPLYDNIADALLLTADGGTHSVALDNTGATFENNEATAAEPQECVWVKIDLSDYPLGFEVQAIFDLVRTGGGGAFSPEFAVFKVIDASFDPTNPDFTKLDYAGDPYVGDGTTNPPEQTVIFKGGTGSSLGNSSLTGIFYLGFNDWNYAEYGAGTSSYSITALPLCFDAIDIINPDSQTASVVSGRVQEDWLDWWDFGSNGYCLPEQTLKFTWTGAAGLYQMLVVGQLSAAGSGAVSLIVSVNGRPFLGSRSSSFSGTTSRSWYPYFGFDAETRDVFDPDSDYDQNPWLVLAPGNLVEIQILSNANLSGSGFNAFQIETVCFIPDGAGPASINCTGGVLFDEAAVGDEWGDVDGWGGQRLIPDQIYADLGYTVDSHITNSEFPWGVNQVDFDFVAREDGTIYVILRDSKQFVGDPGTPPKPGPHRHFVVIKKWDGAAWTQIATLNIRDPADQYMTSSVTAETDGEFIYFAWWEVTTYDFSGTPDYWQSDWHLVKLDPSNDSITELGTGQHSSTAGTNTTTQTADNAEMTGVTANLAPMICPISDNNIFVGVVELVRIAAGVSETEWRRPYVWHWNGSTWTDLALPTPSILGPDPGKWEVSGENAFWDQLLQMVAADQNGPITNGMTLVYSYVYRNVDGVLAKYSVTIPWTSGGGWGTEILTNWMDVSLEQGRIQYNPVIINTETIAQLINHQIMWSEKLGKLVLAGDLLASSGSIWDVFQMNDNGDQWELIEPLAPANNVGGWRQSRNTAAIGPDGDVWRAIFSDDVSGSFNFQPHVFKTSPNYAIGFADGVRNAIGRKDNGVTDPQGNVWKGAYITLYSSTHYRIRWAGNRCYVMGNFYNEPQFVNDTLFANYGGPWPSGEGFWVVGGNYIPCAPFVPRIYRRTYG